MQCMKCGVDVPEGQVFCDKCLELMDRYPVKPGTPVQILPRSPKTAKKKELSPEELLVRQKRINRRLKALVLVLAAALACITIFMLLWALLPGYDLIPGVKRPF